MKPIADSETLLRLLTLLVNTQPRQQAARQLAEYLGAQDLLIFLPDTEVEVLLPAPGFISTLPDGKRWQGFLTSCREASPIHAILPFPDSTTMTTAVGFTGECESVLVLLGGTPRLADAASLVRLLPLAEATFRREQACQIAEAETRVAHADAEQARALLAALDSTRLEAQNEVQERTRVEAALREQIRLTALQVEVSTALAGSNTLRAGLECCARALVNYLDGAFARIWTMNEAEQMLELQVSAGMYTHINGSHARVRVGELKIGLIAREREPHLTNSVVDDPRISDPEWARREGMVAFAGYPLQVGNRVVGVMALFARHQLPKAALETMASVANATALGIERHRAEEAIRQDRQRLEITLAASQTGTFRWNPLTGEFLEFDDNLKRLCGLAPEETVRTTEDFLAHVYPDDRSIITSIIERSRQGTDFESEYRVIHPDGSIHWHYDRGKLQHDERGHPTYIVGACTDITTRKDLERQKEFLMSMVTHELKTPLTSLQGYMQLAERQLHRLQSTLPVQKKIQQDFLSNALSMLSRSRQQLSVQNRLITDLLDASRMQESAIELRPASDDLVSLVCETVQNCQAAHPQRQITLELPEKEKLPVEVDHDRIVQVLSNYLVNALKYSAADKAIHVGITCEPGLARVWVADQGPGLSQEAQQHVWERFYQAPSIAVQNRLGVSLGLGLFISKGIIDGHHGQVGVESAPGQGSCFWFTLPRRTEQA